MEFSSLHCWKIWRRILEFLAFRLSCCVFEAKSSGVFSFFFLTLFELDKSSCCGWRKKPSGVERRSPSILMISWALLPMPRGIFLPPHLLMSFPLWRRCRKKNPLENLSPMNFPSAVTTCHTHTKKLKAGGRREISWSSNNFYKLRQSKFWHSRHWLSASAVDSWRFYITRNVTIWYERSVDEKSPIIIVLIKSLSLFHVI